MAWDKYYKKHKIIPNVDLKDYDLKTLFKQRKSFYRSVGLETNSLKNKTFLELAPGTGYNAFYLLSSGIKNIDLVDFNAEAIKKIKKNLHKFRKKFHVKKIDIDYFDTKKKYDYVMIENALMNLKYPKTTLKKLFSFVKPKGFLIISTSDQFSLFSEKLRGLISHLLITDTKYREKDHKFKKAFLANIFSSHLKSLKVKTRSSSKWVEDNILHYDSFTEKSYLPIDIIINTLDKAFKNNYLMWRTSPSFSTNYSWYKIKNNQNENLNLKKTYQSNLINFLHFKEKFNTYSVNNKKFFQKVSQINKEINKIREDKPMPKTNIKIIIKKISYLIEFLDSIKKKNRISKSLIELNNFLKSYLLNKINLNSLKDFKNFWGHGTFIISILKEK